MPGREPSGYRFWVGVTHQKSKSDNSVEVTAGATVRRSAPTRSCAIEGGPDDVILLGDMNDELGAEFETTESGGDTIAQPRRPAADGFVLVTAKLAKTREISFGGYWYLNFRSLIDHVVVSRA